MEVKIRGIFPKEVVFFCLFVFAFAEIPLMCGQAAAFQTKGIHEHKDWI